MSRPAIFVDFASSRWRWTLSTRLGAIFAIVVAIGSTLYVADIRERTRGMTAELTSLQRTEQRAANRAAPAAMITADQAGSINDAVRRLNMEWSGILAALGDTDAAVGNGVNRVALLTLEPDPATGVVKLSAEAKSLGAMLNYQKQLESRASIESAVITRHEVQLDHAQAPVRFLVEARMRAASERTQ